MTNRNRQRHHRSTPKSLNDIAWFTGSWFSGRRSSVYSALEWRTTASRFQVSISSTIACNCDLKQIWTILNGRCSYWKQIWVKVNQSDRLFIVDAHLWEIGHQWVMNGKLETDESEVRLNKGLLSFVNVAFIIRNEALINTLYLFSRNAQQTYHPSCL